MRSNLENISSSCQQAIAVFLRPPLQRYATCGSILYCREYLVAVYTVHSTTYEGVHQALFLYYDCFLNSLQDVTANAVARNLSLSSNFIGGKRPVLLSVPI
jgi:hypothetical protein